MKESAHVCQDIAHALASMSHEVPQIWQWAFFKPTSSKMGQSASSMGGHDETVALNPGIVDRLLTLAIEPQECAKPLVRIVVWQVQLPSKYSQLLRQIGWRRYPCDWKWRDAVEPEIVERNHGLGDSGRVLMKMYGFAAPDFGQEFIDLVGTDNNEGGVTIDVAREDPVYRAQVVLSDMARIDILNSGPEIVGDDQIR